MKSKTIKMPIKFIIDNRERGLIALFNVNSVPYETRQLDLGDILLLYSKGEIREGKDELSDSAKTLLGEKKEESIENEISTIVFERKSYTDLQASMADSRYHEQKSRYMKLPRGMMYYILENNDPNYEKLGYKQFLGMYVHTMVRDKIPVFNTKSMLETFDFLVKIGSTVEENGMDGIDKAVSVKSTQIKKHKNKGQEVYVQQLCCFPGISSNKAKDISAVYGSMRDLIAAVEGKTFKVKGIGPKILEGIKDGLGIGKSKLIFED